MTLAIVNKETSQPDWHLALSVDELKKDSVKMKRVAGKQIAFFMTPEGVRACDNRCPHEGYPLSEGSLSSGCILTCNWHNWKFNLESGDNLFGGDQLRIYPIDLRGEEIWVEIIDPPYEERYQMLSKSLRDAFDDYSYDRVAREIARLIKLGADPLDVLRLSIDWSWQRLEFGWTHAYGGMADWLTVFNENDGDAETQLVSLVESVTHVAYDVLREPVYPYPDLVTAFDEPGFLAAIESEDESAAIAAVRGGIQDGMQFEDFEPALSTAALAHYNDFGHSIIYVTKLRALVECLGPTVLEPLLLSLVRGFIYASREDKIPEFRAYASQLDKWGQGDARPDSEMWRQKSINKSMKLTLACSEQPVEDIYHALLLANAVNLLSYDIQQQDKIHVTVSGNVGWLDFTHGLTFASAVRQQCSLYPELWPQGLLQMACFNGRNAGFTTDEIDLDSWGSDDPHQQMESLIEEAINHFQNEHIVSVHLIKTALSVRDEIELLECSDAKILLAATNRFFNSAIKRRQPRRTAHQSLQFVEKE
jgi:nitrite reductase/ring-hydroxylating ferredoxin subunit